eukprot:TRINITY_DN30681_c0_g1_i1.p1 TRINITY_DN30681_c0_g1~~TRINITY_DN30681_c0_g1_i1.p1  ORF type:complete len:567 (+),score=49.72 TRINITY_DN30681_c0_g1_i1:108-1808(+)
MMQPVSDEQNSVTPQTSSSWGRILVPPLTFALTVAVTVLVVGSIWYRWRYLDSCEIPEADSQALFDYMTFYACSELLSQPIKALLLLVWLGLIISLLASTADDYFVPQLEELSQRFHLAEDVAGVTLLALGNGMPDVMTAFSSVNKADDFSLSMGEFLGAANFIVVLVLAFCFLTKSGSTKVDPYPFLRDSISYVLVVVFMVYVTWDSTVTFLESASFFIVYVLYVALVILPARFRPRNFARTPIEELEEELDQINDEGRIRNEDVSHGKSNEGRGSSQEMADLDDFMLLESDCEGPREEMKDHLEGLNPGAAEGLLRLTQVTMEMPFTIARHLSIPAANWNFRRRILASICPLGGSLLTMLSFGGWEAFQSQLYGIPLWLFCVCGGTWLGYFIIRGSKPQARPSWHTLLLFMGLVITVSWFNLLANECVAVLETFGLNLGISSSVLGITVLAWGNSVGDLVADTALVKQGRSKMAVAGVFGSPLLSDLLGLGISFISYTSQHGDFKVSLTQQNRVAAAALLVSLLSIILAFAIFRFDCPRGFAYVLLGEYAIFIALSVCAEVGLL